MENLDQLFVNLTGGIVKTIGSFTPDWISIILLILLPIVGIAIFGPVTMMYLTLIERKLLARIQNRYGPNRVGIFGLLQPLADGVKMMTKEDVVPDTADKPVHFLAPILIIIPALLVFSVVPFGRNMIAIDLNIGLLFFLAISATTTIFIFSAAWGSRSKFSLLGGMRSVAQMISYEIPFILSVVPVILIVGSLSTVAIVEAQKNLWFVLTPWGFVGFLIFFLCGVAEVNRTPFDLPEAESEIVAGFHTEYSGMKFALFYMAEFMNTFTVSALVATVYLGGWQGPAFIPSWGWFLIKTYALILVMMWFRGTFPRLRVDQLMGFSWKFLLPLALINILAAGIWYYSSAPKNYLYSGALLTVGIAILLAANKTNMPKKRVYKYAYAD